MKEVFRVILIAVLIIASIFAAAVVNNEVYYYYLRMHNHVLIPAGTKYYLNGTGSIIFTSITSVGPLNYYQSTPLATITGAWNATNLTGISIVLSSEKTSPPRPPINSTGGVIDFTMEANDTAFFFIIFYSHPDDVITLTQSLNVTYRYSYL